MKLIQRTFQLKPDSTDQFLKIVSQYYPKFETDEYIQTYAVLQRDDHPDEIILRFILHDITTWENRLELSYVKDFLSEAEPFVESVATNRQSILKFYHST